MLEGYGEWFPAARRTVVLGWVLAYSIIQLDIIHLERETTCEPWCYYYYLLLTTTTTYYYLLRLLLLTTTTASALPPPGKHGSL